MPRFSHISESRLNTCDERLQRLFREVIKHYDCTIICGHRSEEAQRLAFKDKHSHVDWPNSKHNTWPSLAVDASPYPVDWRTTGDSGKRWYLFAGFVRGVAAALDIPVRAGHDWDGDFDIRDQRFVDLPHFELID